MSLDTFDLPGDSAPTVVDGDLEEVIGSVIDVLGDPDQLGDAHLAGLFEASIHLASEKLVENEHWDYLVFTVDSAECVSPDSEDEAACSILRFHHRGSQLFNSAADPVNYLEVDHVDSNPMFFVDNQEGPYRLVEVDREEAREAFARYTDTDRRGFMPPEVVFLGAFIAEMTFEDNDDDPGVCYIAACNLPLSHAEYVDPLTGDGDLFQICMVHNDCCIYAKYTNEPLLKLHQKLQARAARGNHSLH